MRQPESRVGKGGRPRDADADHAILRAALAMFAETGAEAMSIEGIAERAGVARTTIYRRWRSTDEILLEASRRLIPAVGQTIAGSLCENLPSLAHDFDLMLSRTASGHLLPRALNEIAQGSELGRNYARQVIEPRRKAIADAIRVGIQNGEIRDDLDTELVIDAVIGPILLAHLLRGVGITPPEHLTEQLSAVLLDGIRRPAGHKPGVEDLRR